ncbi:hypothetical protein ACFODO_13375 [Acinetobacter sichuanensis]|uniref:Uncharacterized protein n=1 Tax=Acinetobacter sichuanensis TaxID=2136183 RepID=A0A371YIF1_9GAMM|nr:hypothetical protein [Acinetobacter sichuanensis]RFC81252.1 hypothetical protein C9E89_022870 [Acinetobacter sichuanensis]
MSEKNDSLDTDVKKMKLRYAQHGHLDTPYLIARFAGMQEIDALWLSFYSEYPDEKNDFSAVGQFLKFGTEWRKFVYEKLHSLHGGDYEKIAKRRNQLKKAIKIAVAESDMRKAGLLLHAFGDSFAHTKGAYNTHDETAYGSVIGHAFEGICFHDPDKAFKVSNRQKYIGFITQLFEILKTLNADVDGFNNYVFQVENAKCTRDDCAIDELNLKPVHRKVNLFLKDNIHYIKVITKEELESIFTYID